MARSSWGDSHLAREYGYGRLWRTIFLFCLWNFVGQTTVALDGSFLGDFAISALLGIWAIFAVY